MNCRVRARSLALSLGALGAVLATSCGALPTEEQVNRDLYGNFQTAVASDRNYDVYWMGRSFEAGGLTYKGPEASGRAGGGGLGAGIGLNDADHLGLSYLPNCTCSSLEVTLYSREAWDRFPPRTELPNLKKKLVQVNGQRAQLWTSFDSRAKVSAQMLEVDYGRAIVRATTSSIIPKTPGPEPNPLIDETTFLAAMQNLRPYPQ